MFIALCMSLIITYLLCAGTTNLLLAAGIGIGYLALGFMFDKTIIGVLDGGVVSLVSTNPFGRGLHELHSPCPALSEPCSSLRIARSSLSCCSVSSRGVQDMSASSR